MKMRLAASFTLMLVAGLCSGCSSKSSSSEQPGQQASADDLRTAIQNVADQLTELSARTEQLHKKMTAVDERLIALTGDGSSSEKLTQFTVRIRTAPAAELDGLVSEYWLLRESLRPFEATALTEKVADVDWLIDVRRQLATPITAEKLLNLEMLTQQVPPTYSGTIAEGYLEQFNQAIVQFASDLVAKGPADADELEVVLDLLEQLESQNAQPTESIAKVRTAVGQRLETARHDKSRDEFSGLLKSLNDQQSALRKITDTDLRFAALMNLRQGIENLRLQRALEGGADATPELAALQNQVAADLEKIGQEQRAKLSRARMQYQAWTLKEIAKLGDFLDQKQVEAELYRLRDRSADESGPVVVTWADFAGVRQLLQEGVGQLAENRELSPEQKQKIGPLIQEKWTQLVEQVRHDAAVRHLLHIDQNLLEPPVTKFYNEAFENVWKALEDRSDLRLSPGQKTAEIQKRSLDAFLETGNE
ncbi:MAG: hypothetical protein ACKOEO_10325 [Planctomycetaceae bacterium]